MVITLKKIVLFLFILTLIILFNYKEEYVIPNDSIRFRILANSNSIEDQLLKTKIKNKIKNQIFDNMNNITSFDEASKKVKLNINSIKKIINQYTSNYDINYGDNYFPKKEYRGVKYPEGNYKSLVITLGEGLGDNWWCVLYPPLCLIDEESDNTTYDLYIKRLFQKLNS